MVGRKDHYRLVLGLGFIGCFCFYAIAVKTGVSERPVAATQPDSRALLRKIYTAEIGIREATGHNDGTRVQEYLQVVGLRGNYPYCAAFVSWAFHEAGKKEPQTAWNPALFPAAKVIWTQDQQKPTRAMQGLTTVNLQRTTPLSGDVFGIYFSELRRIAHCGFVDQWDGIWCTTVEANTNDVGSVPSADSTGNPIRAGPGEGVYRKKRLIKTIYKVADWVSASSNK